MADWLDGIRADVLLWYVHFLACFAGLAYLPFSKIFHTISSPVSLLVDAAVDRGEKRDRAGAATRRALGLDACTHCGACTERCSVAPIYRSMSNPAVLPSEKLRAVGALARGRRISREGLEDLSEGSFLCTLCHRCTDVCPVGIDLQDLWQASRRDLAARGLPEPHVWVLQTSTAAWAERVRGKRPRVGGQKQPLLSELSRDKEALSACVQCQTCTNVCPVVGCAEDPEGDLGMTPQQVMNLVRMGLRDVALGSRMVWDCLTCYQCQENCPEGIQVADILYELRNLGYAAFRPLRDHDPAPTDPTPRVRFSEDEEAPA